MREKREAKMVARIATPIFVGVASTFKELNRPMIKTDSTPWNFQDGFRKMCSQTRWTCKGQSITNNERTEEEERDEVSQDLSC